MRGRKHNNDSFHDHSEIGNIYIVKEEEIMKIEVESVVIVMMILVLKIVQLLLLLMMMKMMTMMMMMMMMMMMTMIMKMKIEDSAALWPLNYDDKRSWRRGMKVRQNYLPPH